MGTLIDEDDCEVCVVFDQEWIFTYGDLVTLLLCFFILLFSSCKYETMKFKSLAASFKPLPAGTPYMNEGKDSIVEQIAQQLEESELGDDANINVEEKGVVVSFKASAYFKADSAKLNPKAVKEMTRFSKLIFLLPNKIQIEGHTEKTVPESKKRFSKALLSLSERVRNIAWIHPQLQRGMRHWLPRLVEGTEVRLIALD